MTTPPTFQKKILTWFTQHGRKTLPWQINKTPYRVWVSEIMLQQTQVTTVIPYFLRFMEKFPDITTLANAPEDEVLHLWTGLGYYTRARNLHRTAKIITDNFSNQFPADQSALENLPGIGRSTAGAILAIAFEKRAAILDGNVKRVLTRYHGITEWPGEKSTHEKLWQLAEKFTPTKQIANYTQAMMDMGATLCTRSKPNCTLCPLQTSCAAYTQGIQNTLPKSKPKKSLPIRQTTLLIFQHHQNVLLEKRPPAGIWGSLWSLPEIAGQPTLAEIKQFCTQRFRLEITDLTPNNIFRHTFSHFHLDISPMLISIKKPKRKLMEDAQQIWYNLQEPVNLGLPAPIKLLLSKL